jgi:hypothetical protein
MWWTRCLQQCRRHGRESICDAGNIRHPSQRPGKSAGHCQLFRNRSPRISLYPSALGWTTMLSRSQRPILYCMSGIPAFYYSDRAAGGRPGLRRDTWAERRRPGRCRAVQRASGHQYRRQWIPCAWKTTWPRRDRESIVWRYRRPDRSSPCRPTAMSRLRPLRHGYHTTAPAEENAIRWALPQGPSTASRLQAGAVRRQASQASRLRTRLRHRGGVCSCSRQATIPATIAALDELPVTRGLWRVDRVCCGLPLSVGANSARLGKSAADHSAVDLGSTRPDFQRLQAHPGHARRSADQQRGGGNRRPARTITVRADRHLPDLRQQRPGPVRNLPDQDDEAASMRPQAGEQTWSNFPRQHYYP